MDGVIDRGGRLERLTPEEYEYWLRNPLPFGWMIVAAPWKP